MRVKASAYPRAPARRVLRRALSLHSTIFVIFLSHRAPFSRQDPMPTRQPFTQVDAFADRPFAGNPAAVCVLPAARDAAWMQDVAREMNLSETAFLHPEGDDFRLRWF